MLQLLQMWAIMEVLGIVFLPLTITVFQRLAAADGFAIPPL
jgi:hypothetical protein